MCLVVKSKWHKDGKPFIAGEDFPVFKVLHKAKRRTETPFQECPVVFTNGKAIIESKLCIVKLSGLKDPYFCHIGIHAYLNCPSAKILESQFPKGLNLFVYKAIIPKGTQYLIGINGDIVSTKMIIFDKECHEK